MLNIRGSKFFVLTAFVFLTSCYKEYYIWPEHQNNIFSFVMLAAAEKKILDSRGEQFTIEPLPQMNYGGTNYLIGKMSIRGQSVLDFQRKSYSINMNGSIELVDSDSIFHQLEKFKLISMVFDYTYIENRLSQLLLNEIELWPLCSFFTEIEINAHHQGLYLFIEDPVDYFIEKKHADCVLRRYYRNEISSIDLNPYTASNNSDYYIEQFKSIYTNHLTNYSGEQLFNELTRHLNIKNYMRKMAFDYIVENGDYVDEIYFYGTQKNDICYFDILPWDYDDLFSDSPHEVGREWAIGTIFGKRIYNSKDDVLNELNGRLIFSLEDDLDYAIATDDYLYRKYLEQLRFVTSAFSKTILENTFTELHNKLYPFYQKPEIIDQSKYDANATSIEIFNKNFHEKKTRLFTRIDWINKQLENQ